MYYKLKLKNTNKYLSGVFEEGILMLIDDKDQDDIIILNEYQINQLKDDSFFDELTLKEIYFNDLEKVKI
jgi:inorganic pyrophosphatase